MPVSPPWGSLPAEKYFVVRSSIQSSPALVPQAFGRRRTDTLVTLHRTTGTTILPWHQQSSANS